MKKINKAQAKMLNKMMDVIGSEQHTKLKRAQQLVEMNLGELHQQENQYGYKWFHFMPNEAGKLAGKQFTENEEQKWIEKKFGN